MWDGIFSYVLVAALATALLVAALTDLRRREIDNGLNAAIALSAPLWWLAMGFGWIDVAFQLALAACTFVLASVLFALRQMGGGDVKLLTVLALWFAPASFMQLIVLMAVIGGGASVAMAAFNMKRLPGQFPRDVLAFAAAAAWVWGACAVVLALATHRPMIDGQTVSAIAALFPRAWVLALSALALVTAIAVGLSHIVRRQKRRLPIPYGIAIAAAGLWVLGDHTLAAAHLAAQSR